MADSDNDNMEVTAESIIALVGIVLALPPCIVLVWKWRLIRRALRNNQQNNTTSNVAESNPSETRVPRISLGDDVDVDPILPLHHGQRTLSGSTAGTKASSMTCVPSRVPSFAKSTATNNSSMTDVSSSAAAATTSTISSKALPPSSTIAVSSLPVAPPSSNDNDAASPTTTLPTTRTPFFCTENMASFLNHNNNSSNHKQGDGNARAPQRIELIVMEGKIQSIQLLCRHSFSPLFRIPGYPYSLESPV
ncbi:uncharacterized protein PG986_009738 [Apiospora aurea]|uniref:Membrane-associated protein n=1 Tax=Apiospora aurea TaxID=335848 RepID=A0ABR1Q974_9PEZI